MTKKKTTRKKSSSRTANKPLVDSETRDWITVVIILAITVVAYMQMGIVGVYLSRLCRFLFGKFYYVILGAVVIQILITMINRKDGNTRSKNPLAVIAIILAVLLMCAYADTPKELSGFQIFTEYVRNTASFFSEEPAMEPAGGIIGAFLFALTTATVDRVGTVLVIIVLFIIAALLLVNLDVYKQAFNTVWTYLSTRDDEEEDGDDDTEEDEEEEDDTEDDIVFEEVPFEPEMIEPVRSLPEEKAQPKIRMIEADDETSPIPVQPIEQDEFDDTPEPLSGFYDEQPKTAVPDETMSILTNVKTPVIERQNSWSDDFVMPSEPVHRTDSAATTFLTVDDLYDRTPRGPRAEPSRKTSDSEPVRPMMTYEEAMRLHQRREEEHASGIRPYPEDMIRRTHPYSSEPQRQPEPAETYRPAESYQPAETCPQAETYRPVAGGFEEDPMYRRQYPEEPVSAARPYAEEPAVPVRPYAGEAAAAARPYAEPAPAETQPAYQPRHARTVTNRGTVAEYPAQEYPVRDYPEQTGMPEQPEDLTVYPKAAEPAPAVPETPAGRRSNKPYKLPKLNILDPVPPRAKDDVNAQAAREKGELLIQALRNFDIEARLIDTHIGPSVTQFEIRPDANVKVSRILGLADDIKMQLAVKDVRIEAPIPGHNAVGVEIPNQKATPVKMKELFTDLPDGNAEPLLIVLGKDLLGKTITCRLDKMPHLMIAGATGSGKSVCMNSIITSLLLRTKPDDVKMLLVDPKKVEFTPYQRIPHLIGPVINDPTQASNALKVIVKIMDERYDFFAKAGVRNIQGYNKMVSEMGPTQEDGSPSPKKMPYIVVIVDEMADLMNVAGKEVESSIQRITQLARAAGIHLIIATQRPSTDVITGVIKANIPSRIAFAVSSGIDSRTILDHVGAERLLGNGDMLYMPIGVSSPTRVQGVFITDEEVKRITDYVSAEAVPMYDDSFIRLEGVNDGEGSVGGVAGAAEDPLFDEIRDYVVDVQKASTSLLQRRFGIGYNRAARMIDLLEEKGIIGPAQGSKPREVYIKKDE